MREISFVLTLYARSPCLTIEIASVTTAINSVLCAIADRTRIVLVAGPSFMRANRIVLQMAAEVMQRNWILRVGESPVNSAACLIEMDIVVNGAINRRARRNVVSRRQIESWGTICPPQVCSMLPPLPKTLADMQPTLSMARYSMGGSDAMPCMNTVL